MGAPRPPIMPHAGAAMGASPMLPGATSTAGLANTTAMVSLLLFFVGYFHNLKIAKTVVI